MYLRQIYKDMAFERKSEIPILMGRIYFYYIKIRIFNFSIIVECIEHMTKILNMD